MSNSTTNRHRAMIDSNRLFHTLAYMLRHAPRKFGIVLSEDGSTSLELLVLSLIKYRKEYRDITPATIQDAIRNLDTERFELRGNWIRARYGHSVDVSRIGKPETPPDFLFHATATDDVPMILSDGLQPMDRYFVHLTSNLDYASSVGIAKGDVCILQVRARLAYEAGLPFYRANSHVWLTNEIPFVFLTGNS